MQEKRWNLTLALTLLLVCVWLGVGETTVFARGGFGGGGGGGFRGGGGGGFREGGGGGFREGGGGFGGGFGGYRGGFEGYHNGFDGYRGQGEMRSDAFHDFDRGFDQPFEHVGGIGGIGDGGLGFSHPMAAQNNLVQNNGVRNYGVQRSLASDAGFNNVIRPGGGSALAAGNRTWRATPASLANQGGLVRNNFNNWGYFRNDWWRNYPNAWHRGWWNDYWPWQWSTWGGLAGLWGLAAADLPVYYDYGDNITYDGGNVDYGPDVVCSAGDYYQQAADIANSGQTEDFGVSAVPGEMTPPLAQGSSSLSTETGKKSDAKHNASESSEWKPFGVYSLVQGGQTNSTTMFQLCTNKKGQIRGNYYNALTNEVEPLKGAIDKKRMRAAWTVGKDTNVVYDTGVANLLKDQSPILIHFSKDNTQQWTLVRLKNQSGAKSKA